MPEESSLPVFLRALADFYEERPNLPPPYIASWSPATVYLRQETAIEHLKSIGSFEKEFVGESFKAVKMIGGRRVEFSVDRNAICEKVVVGTRHVDAWMRPAELVEAHDEEIVEWKCPESIFGKESDETADQQAAEPSEV